MTIGEFALLLIGKSTYAPNRLSRGRSDMWPVDSAMERRRAADEFVYSPVISGRPWPIFTSISSNLRFSA